MHFSLPPQIYYYADSIYATAGVKQNDIQYVTVGTGAVNVFMTIAAVGTLLSLLTIVVNDGRNWKLQSVVWSYEQETVVLNSQFVLPGLHRGGLWATAAPPLWFWDLLCSVCAAHCRSQLPGTTWNLQCDSQPQHVTLLPSSGSAHNLLYVRVSQEVRRFVLDTES